MPACGPGAIPGCTNALVDQAANVRLQAANVRLQAAKLLRRTVKPTACNPEHHLHVGKALRHALERSRFPGHKFRLGSPPLLLAALLLLRVACTRQMQHATGSHVSALVMGTPPP